MKRRVLVLSTIAVLIGIAGALAAISWREDSQPLAHPSRSVAKETPIEPARGGWPNLFGPTHDSRSEDAILTEWPAEGPPELWRIKVGTGYSSPIVVNGAVILLHRIGDEEFVSCFDASTGKQRWEYRYPTTFECGSHYTSGPYSTPAADGKVVITMGAQGQLHCLRLSDGKLLWSRQTSEEFDVEPDIFGVGHSPLIWNDQVIFNIGGRSPDSGIIAFNPIAGEILWQATNHGPSYATPQPALIDGRERLFVLTKDGLVMLDPNDGHVYFEIPYASKIPDGYSAVTPVVSGNLVFFSIYGKGSLCIRVDENDQYTAVWEDRRTLTSQYNPLLLDNGCVYGIHVTDTSFRCIDLATAELQWRWKSELRRSTHLIVGNYILIMGEFGELGLIELNAEEPVECAMMTDSVFDGQRCYAAPALADSRLYLRNEQELVCLDLSP